MRGSAPGLALLLVLSAGCFGPEHLEPEQGGRDYQLQGEYANESYGAQVIALGHGRFRAVLHEGGLPGAGAGAGTDLPATATGRDDGQAVALRGDFDGALKDGTLRVHTAGGESAVMRRIERESPTLGAAPPAGAVVLFGKPDLAAFAEGKLDPRGFLAAGARTKERFGSFTPARRVPDARACPPADKGQARGNSGVYLQDRYEIQVLDSFGARVEGRRLRRDLRQAGAADERLAARPASGRATTSPSTPRASTRAARRDPRTRARRVLAERAQDPRRRRDRRADRRRRARTPGARPARVSRTTGTSSPTATSGSCRAESAHSRNGGMGTPSRIFSEKFSSVAARARSSM